MNPATVPRSLLKIAIKSVPLRLEWERLNIRIAWTSAFVRCANQALCRRKIVIEIFMGERDENYAHSFNREIYMRLPFIALAILLYAAIPARGAVVEYTNKLSWQNDVGSYNTITFTELPANTWITTQYDHLGVTFTDGSDQVAYMPGAFVNDDYGLNGALDETTLVFSQPMYTVAVDFPGYVQFELYYKQELVYISNPFDVIGGIGGFAGLISDQPFDEVRMFDPTSGFFIDDLHFGPAIPAPGALGLIALAGAVTLRRKRRS